MSYPPLPEIVYRLIVGRPDVEDAIFQSLLPRYETEIDAMETLDD